MERFVKINLDLSIDLNHENIQEDTLTNQDYYDTLTNTIILPGKKIEIQCNFTIEISDNQTSNLDKYLKKSDIKKKMEKKEKEKEEKPKLLLEYNVNDFYNDYTNKYICIKHNNDQQICRIYDCLGHNENTNYFDCLNEYQDIPSYFI